MIKFLATAPHAGRQLLTLAALAAGGLALAQGSLATIIPPYVEATGQVGLRTIVTDVPGGQLVILQTPEANYIVTGSRVDELRRLRGATVRAFAMVEDEARLEVLDFDILDIGDGRRPLVGEIFVAGQDVFLVDQASGLLVALSGAGADILREQAGSLAWVVGQFSDSALNVDAFNVFRPATAEEAPRPGR